MHHRLAQRVERTRARRRSGRPAAIAMLLWSVCASTAAQGPALAGVSVSWDAPDSCPPSDQVLQRARRLLGPAFVAREEIEIEIEIESRDAAFVLTLEVDSDKAQGERRLQMPTCTQVREAAALLIALVLDPDLDLQQPTAEAKPQPERSTVDNSASEPALHVGPRLGTDTSLLPGVSLVLGGQLELSVGRLYAALGAVYFLPRDATPTGYTVPIDAIAGRARVGAWVLQGPGLGIGAFAGLLLGSIGGGAQVPGASSKSELLLSPEVGGLASFDIGAGFALSGSLAALLPQKRPRFQLDLGDVRPQLHSVPRFSALAEVAIVYRL